MSDQSGNPPAGWHPDPHQRHEQRYWDGTGWTDQVADGGQASTDPTPSAAPSAGDTQVVPTPGTAPGAGGPGTPAPPGAPTHQPGTRSTGPNWGLIIGIGAAVIVVIVLVIALTGGDDGGLGPDDSVTGSVEEDETATFDITGDGEEVTIEVEGLGGFDPTVEVEDSSGDEIGSDDDSGDEFDAELDVDLEEGESYEILVEGFQGQDGEFRLTIS